jgi:hypothetical protein
MINPYWIAIQHNTEICTGLSEYVYDVVAPFLAREREETLERAAEVAEGCFPAEAERDCGCIPQVTIAKAIRSLR